MRLRVVVAVILVLVVAGCSAGDDGAGEDGFVVSGKSEAPESCQPDAVGSLVVGFFNEFNTSDIAHRVDEFVAPAGRFGWFSVSGTGERLNDDARDRDGLGEYLQQRADSGEELHLIAMDTAYERGRNITHIAYNVERTAPDIRTGSSVVVGKGAIDCESGKITVWSMGLSDGGPQALCSSAPTPVEAEPAIVCVRESHQS